MAKIINLRAARKQVKRAQKEQKAEQNRIRHGLTKTQRQIEQARELDLKRKLDGHKLNHDD